jgi:hypothetical protein
MSTIVLATRTHATSLSNLLFEQTRGRILATLHGRPDEAFLVRQIARRADVSIGAAQREFMKNLQLWFVSAFRPSGL